ncbi:MAG: DUF4389 domain-containing protein [Myxococcota bacterium]
MTDDKALIERSDTGIRALQTLLFLLIGRLIEGVLLVVILYELIVVALTRQPPSAGVRRFANRTVSYFYRIGRFLTYNESRAPFPFDEFPEEIEAPEPLSAP